MEKRVIIYSYYSPEELTGIGKYNGEMIEFLLDKNLEVISISNVPFYPYWEKYPGHKNSFYQQHKSRFIDIRTYVYIPSSPGATKKILSEVSFFLTSFLAFVANWRSVGKSTLIIVINPPFFLGLIPICFSWFTSVRLLFHIQDLQVDAARELKLLPSIVCRFLERMEKWLLRQADFVSTISMGMVKKIAAKKVNREILLMPNWSDLNFIVPMPPSNWLHDYIGIDHAKKLIVYSGNIGEKQGLDIVLNAAKELEEHDQLHFVILGEGLYKVVLQKKIESLKLKNLTLGSLVPKEKMNQMLNDSFIQLVIQKGEGADSFLPSKLTNILAAGCASIVTANSGTSLYDILASSRIGKLIPPDSQDDLVVAIKDLTKEELIVEEMKINARIWAEENLSIDQCLSPLMRIID